MRCWYYAIMVQVTIRNIPEEVRDTLAVRAAQQRQSMQGFLLSELERIASTPSVAEVLRDIRERKAAMGSRVSPASILEARYADRR